MKSRLFLFISILLIVIALDLQGQANFKFKNISINQGLSQSTVSDILEDSKGMLWFATFDGLNKYNGKKFTVFRANPGSTVRLKSAKINKLFLAPNDLLLIYTDLGLDVMNLKTEQLIPDSVIKIGAVYAPCIYDDSSIIFGNASNEIVQYNTYTSKAIKLLQYKNTLNRKARISAIIPLEQSLYLVFEKNIIQHITKNGELKNQYEVNEVLQRAQMYNNKILISTRKKGILEIDVNTQKQKWYQQSLGILNIVKTIEIDNQIYGLSYGHGMLKLDTADYRIISPSQEPNKNVYITSSYKDKKNNIWIGTDGEGLNFYNKSQLIFKTLTLGKLGSVRGIVQDKDKLYIATFSNGCFSYDLKSKRIEQVYFSPNKFNNAIGYHDGKLWIGNDHNGVDIYDLRQRKIIKNIPFFNQDLLKQHKSRIYRIDELDEEHMVVSTRSEGFAIVNKKNYQVIKNIHQNNTTLSSSDVRFVTLSRDKQKVYACMVYDGLAIFSYPDLKLIKTIRNTKENHQKISVKHIREDNQGNLWLGTNGTGVLVYDKNYNQLAHWNTQNYLKNNVVYTTQTEGNNAIWISSNEGLSRILYKQTGQNLSIEDIQNFNTNNGLQSNEFNTGAYLKTKKGLLAFGGLDNINLFNPRSLNFDRNNGRVSITDFFVQNKQLNSTNVIHYLNEVKLSAKQNDIGISFIVPGYNEGIEIEYRYRLLGYQKSWQHIGTRNNVDFTNLPAGSYEFQVQARYLNNFWDNNITKLIIEIETPFYKTWWFYILLGLGGILLIASIIRLRINYMRNINKNNMRLMIESQETERSRISRELHDDFGGRLSTLKLYMEAIKMQPNQAQEIAKNTSKIIDQSILELRNILLNLSPKTLSDDGLATALQEIANSINKTNLIQVNTSYSLSADLKPSASISIYRIVYELINNSIKHAEASHIEISITGRKDAIVLLYEDNGKGLQKGARSTGYGLSNIQNHLQAHDAEGYTDSKEGQGYHFTAEFPVDIVLK